jgi:hypothetical protein
VREFEKYKKLKRDIIDIQNRMLEKKKALAAK